MSKTLVVYRDKALNKVIVEYVQCIPHASTLVLPQLNSDGSVYNVTTLMKYFGAYTLDGAYRYVYSAYVDASIAPYEITQDVADTIFMMAKKKKIEIC